MSWYTSTKVWAFVGGVAATGVASVLAKNPSVRKAAVNGVAQGMLLKENVEGAIQSIKDDAEDTCAEARVQAKLDAERAARMQEIEERVRVQVLAEMEAEDAKAAESKED